MGLREVIKGMVAKLLNIQPAEDSQISIKETLSHAGTVLRNRIWVAEVVPLKQGLKPIDFF